MEVQELLLTAARAGAVYVLMLIVVRFLGKRTVGNFTAFDLIVALMLGEVVDEIIYGDVSLAQGCVAILVVAAAKYLTAWLTYGSTTLSRLFEGAPTELVSHGEFVRDGMRKEMINEQEVFAAVRLQGVSDLREVKTALMEVDGQVSIIREDWAEPLQKADVLGAKANQLTGEERRTDTPAALGERR